MESDLRVDFLVALENLMQNSPWFSKGQYRKDDIREAEWYFEAYEGDSSFSKAAYVCCCCCLESFIHSLTKNFRRVREGMSPDGGQWTLLRTDFFLCDSIGFAIMRLDIVFFRMNNDEITNICEHSGTVRLDF